MPLKQLIETRVSHAPGQLLEPVEGTFRRLQVPDEPHQAAPAAVADISDAVRAKVAS